MITLATLEKATAQEVFDQVINHAFTMEKRSGYTAEGSDKDFICKYRHEGNKCFAGALISDSEYCENFETQTWTNLVRTHSGIFPDEHKDLINQLQVVHDQFLVEIDRNMHEYFDKKFIEIARENNLNYTPRF